MHKGIKILRNILFLFIIITIAIHISPTILAFISNMVMLTDDQLSNALTALDIIFSSVIAIYSLVEQKIGEKRCLYEFAIEKDNLSLEAYRRFSTELNNAYSYDYRRKSEDIEKPFYGVEVELQDKAFCSVGIPLRMEVSTGLYGNSIVFSNLRVFAKKNGTVIAKKQMLSKFLIIDMPIKDEKKFLVRIQLLCNQQLEKALWDSRIYLSFALTFIDDRGRKYNKYLFLTVQNTIMGESSILSVSSRNNWFMYIVKLAMQQYKLYHT